MASTRAHPLSVSVQGFVLAVTIIREAVEEIRCYVRDKEVNSQVYSRLTARGQPPGPSGATSCSRAPSVCGGWPTGLQLNHGPLTVREQSSRPGASGCVGAPWQGSHSLPAPGRPASAPGPGVTPAASLGCHCSLRASPVI